MAAFLSQAWLDEVRRLASDGPRPDVSSRVQWVVKGGPGAPGAPTGGRRSAGGPETRFYLILDHGRPVEAMVGSVDDADITLSIGYDDAAAVVRGELDLSVAFMQGRLKADGDMGALLGVLPSAESAAGAGLLGRIAAATDW